MAWVNIIDLLYPVGTIVMQNAKEELSPQYNFGGTWEQVAFIEPNDTTGDIYTLNIPDFKLWKKTDTTEPASSENTP